MLGNIIFTNGLLGEPMLPILTGFVASLIFVYLLYTYIHCVLFRSPPKFFKQELPGLHTQ